MNGSRTYYLPGSEVEVEVNYEIDEDEVCFDGAAIDGEPLDCSKLLIEIDTTSGEDLVRTSMTITLARYFQRELNNDADDIFEEHEIVCKSYYDEHYPAGLL